MLSDDGVAYSIHSMFLLSALFLGSRLYDFGGGAHLGGFSTSLDALRQCLESFDDLLNMRLGSIGESGRVFEVLR